MKESIYTSYDELPLLLSVKQLVDLMGVSDSTIYELIQEPDFPSLRIGKAHCDSERGTAKVDQRSHKGGTGMIGTPFVKKDSVSNYFPVPNAVFDLELHHIEIGVYTYLMRIEDRRTWQCIVSYSTIAQTLGLSVNTVAKYVSRLEEHGFIRTERTEVTTREGLKRNGCLRYTILPIRNAIGLYHERKLAALQRTSDIERAKKAASKGGIDYSPPRDGQSA